MTTKVLALYGPPADPARFDAYYMDTHVPKAKRMPGLLGYTLSRKPPTALDGSTPYHAVATLEFADMAAFQAALASPEGQATAADLGNFASGGVTVLVFDERQI